MTTTPFTRTMNKNLVTIKTIEDERSIKTIYKAEQIAPVHITVIKMPIKLTIVIALAPVHVLFAPALVGNILT